MIGPLQKQTSQVPSPSTSSSAGAGGSWLSQLFLPLPHSRSFKSHCSLWLVSLFLYHRLIHPATSEPLVGLSATLQRLQKMSKKKKKNKRSRDDTGMRAHSQSYVSCDFRCSAVMYLYASPTFEEMVYHGERGEVPGVGKFMMKHRNPLLRDFHTLARLRV